MTSKFITIEGVSNAEVEVTPSATDRRDALALTCGTVQSVTNQTQAEHAGAVLKEVKGFTRLIEDSRKIVKEPVLDLTRRIDGLARQLTETLNAEATRIGQLLGTYQAVQEKEAALIRKKALDEERHLREKIEEQRHLAALLAESPSEAEQALAAVDEQACEDLVRARALVLSAEPAKVAGVSTRPVMRFEMVDAYTLAVARPDLVRIEPNAAAIHAILRANPNASIPGLRTWEEFTSVVR